MFSVNLLYLFRDISVMFFCVFSGSASKASGAAAGDGYFFREFCSGFFWYLFRVFSGSALQASGAAERSGDEAAEPAGGRERDSDKGREQQRHPT